jgi:hypothetical protein
MDLSLREGWRQVQFVFPHHGGGQGPRQAHWTRRAHRGTARCDLHLCCAPGHSDRWSIATNARLADSKTGASLRPLAETRLHRDPVPAKDRRRGFPGRSGEPIVGYRKMWLRIAKLGDLPTDVTPHVLRHSFASLAAGLGNNEPTIASHSANTVLVAAADAVANATQSCGMESRLHRCFRDTQDRATDILPRLGTAAWDEFTSL